jgi:hypothetical protein
VTAATADYKVLKYASSIQEECTPWMYAANGRSAGQEIPVLLWNPEVNYRFQNSPPLFTDISFQNKCRLGKNQN